MVLIMTSLSGILPILLALKLRSFYIIPAQPFFSLGIGALLVPLFADALDRAGKRARQSVRVAVGAGLLGVGLYTASVAGQYARDAVLLQDIAQVSTVVPPGSGLYVPPEWIEQYHMFACFVRFGQISATCYHLQDWRIFPRETDPAAILAAGYREDTTLRLRQWRLARR
jgi:hypothetical protein